MPRKTRVVAMPPASLAATEARKKSPTGLQEQVCHLAADLIMNGGQQSDVTNLLRATIGHSLHIRFPEFDAWHEGRAKSELPDLLRRISREWPAPKTEAEPKRALPETVSEMARTNVTRSLQRRFEEFLGNARVHELYLLDNVLGDFDSCGTNPFSDSAESPLAEAFMLALGSDDTYVKVPRDCVDAVEEFLAAIEDEDAPIQAPVGRPKLLLFPGRQMHQEAPHAS